MDIIEAEKYIRRVCTCNEAVKAMIKQKDQMEGKQRQTQRETEMQKSEVSKVAKFYRDCCSFQKILLFPDT